MTLGEKIYTLRSENNLSQGDLANALDVSRQSVSKWETGTSVPDLDKLIRMSEVFGVSLDELVRGEKPLELSRPAEPSETPAQKSFFTCAKNCRTDTSELWAYTVFTSSPFNHPVGRSDFRLAVAVMCNNMPFGQSAHRPVVLLDALCADLFVSALCDRYSLLVDIRTRNLPEWSGDPRTDCLVYGYWIGRASYRDRPPDLQGTKKSIIPALQSKKRPKRALFLCVYAKKFIFIFIYNRKNQTLLFSP